MQRLLALTVTIAIASPAIAGPAGVPAEDSDDTAVVVVPVVPVVVVPAPPPPRRNRAKLYAAGGLALTYGLFSTYAYFAWFRGKENRGMGITFDGFGVTGYAGGADKLGHAWTGYLLSRATTGFLTTAGWPRLESSIVAASISQVFFTLSEFEDSLIYQFEISDVIAHHDALQVRGYRSYVDPLATRGLLKHGLDPAEATDVLLTLVGSDVFLNLTEQRRWPTDRYIRWTTDTLCALILERPTTADVAPHLDVAEPDR